MEPIQNLRKFADTDLYELHDRLWYEYFCPLKPHNKADKAFLMKQLNAVGVQLNKEAKQKEWEVQIVTPATKFEWDELGPNSRVKIYVDTREQNKSAFTVRANKISAKTPHKENTGPKFHDEEDLLGGNEDLMGDSKPTKKVVPLSRTATVNKMIGVKRSADPNKITATSIYPELAKLADKLGDNADKISKARPEWPRKCITDALWKWRKTK